MDKKLGGDTAETVDPDWSKGYIPYRITTGSAIKTGGRVRRRCILSPKGAIAQTPAGH